ncbi:MAG: hypothetical protein MJ247_02870 [Alphaproteobacteria bacterium]|nr:hypothetical protein [Alphaproteobacteria bacterium]
MNKDINLNKKNIDILNLDDTIISDIVGGKYIIPKPFIEPIVSDDSMICSFGGNNN